MAWKGVEKLQLTDTTMDQVQYRNIKKKFKVIC